LAVGRASVGLVTVPYGTRRGPLKVTGPTEVKELTAGLERAYAADINIRIADEDRTQIADAWVFAEFKTALARGSARVGVAAPARIPPLERLSG
jgi:hypothetical protein